MITYRVWVWHREIYIKCSIFQEVYKATSSYPHFHFDANDNWVQMHGKLMTFNPVLFMYRKIMYNGEINRG